MTHAYLYFLSLLLARTVIVYFFVVFGLRLMGKRELGQMHIYDVALLMALANAVQNAMTSGAGDLTVGIVCAGTLLILGRVLTGLFIRLPRFEERVCGTPTILVNDGKPIEDHLRRERVTKEQVMAALRQHGLCELNEVQMAILEIDGSISIVPRRELPQPSFS
jgi:uncharacterized membrane protein YcaP (DUF421 family)